jgi:DNA-binding MarR family transcriptional regulator
MTDVKSPLSAQATSLLYLREDELRRGIELLFFGYRDFLSEADGELAGIGLGRAHHRALHFIGRKPDLPVNELLSILKITKQSLGRVLKDLLGRGLIEQKPGRRDRRQRLLSLTPDGLALHATLLALQRARMARAFREAGPEAVAGFRKVLSGLIAEDERTQVLAMIGGGA